MKKYRVVNKNRFYLFITSLLIIILIISTSFISSLKAHGMVLKENYKEYTVYPGDTLWNIALKYKPNNYDVRDMVYEIRDFNDMNTFYITPGEILKVPVIEN
ncbi:MAG TPA: LysM peptidoglycan-binding domain-containing protein [Tissierellaceae bacterium]|nr:LysM peptidoglycan-binding domain-containing protein [Tissierellaceae bacterium]